ncbi:SNF2-related protein [Methanomassiliicoccales archaeon LGM-DZ1]|nr:SNF2-related protein [Methanomassiliicoccales archaeon LGM-DZ1]
MTLKSIDLKPQYISLEDDVADQFYIPVMSNCTRFDRISCYFTLDALAKYCTGLYYLGRNNGRFRLLISHEVSEETFNAIREGYRLSQYLDGMVKERMRQELSLEDTVKLSNLAYLMECGLVEIKFAMCCNGLFHEKSGYAEDSEGNCLCFNGSNNETKMSFDSNYEKFEVTASWLSSEFDRRKISGEREEFDSLWGGTNVHVIVSDPPESFDRYLMSVNKGKLFRDAQEYLNDCFYLDISGGTIRLSLPESVENPGRFKFKLAVQGLVDRIEGRTLVMKPELPTRSVRSMMDKVVREAGKEDREVSKSDTFMKYLSEHTSMDHLALLGMSIKQRDPGHREYFEMFKKEVSNITASGLRDEQLWDAYFAYRLKKSANFSVPGSGKTATALGMFAFLNRTAGVDKLIVIGPLNSFDSWITEFRRVFGTNIPLDAVTSTDLRNIGGTIQYHVRFDLGRHNLVLINYEAFEHNLELTEALRNRIDDRTMLVFDEVHRIKAIGGKRAEGAVPIARNSKYTIVMTGTPIPNNYADVYNFLHILYGDDYDDYFVLGPKELSELKGADAKDFNKKLQPFYCRTTKNKLNVPPANMDNVLSLTASAKENDLFRKLHESKMNPLVLMVRILQLESNPIMLGETALEGIEASSFSDDGEKPRLEGMRAIEGAEDLMTSKTKACVDLVRSLASSGKSVIVWCIFVRSIRTLAQLLEAEGASVCTVYGDTPDRQTVIDGFKSGRYQVMITNPQTLAESVSLHNVCHDAVYFEYSYNLVHMLQSKDRIHRLGLAEGQYTQYHFLETLFEDDGKMVSLDEAIHDSLDHKEKVMLDAIENDSLEQFATTREEIEDLLASIGFDSAKFE